MKQQVSLEKRVMVPTPMVEILSTRATGIVVNDWWDPNAEGLCIVAAYRAIATPGTPWTNDEPANYAATLVNNANPGINDLVELNGAVPWAIAAGWQFNALAIQAFDTGVIPDQNYTVLVQFANNAVAGRTVAGVDNIGAANGFYLQPDTGVASVRYHKGTSQLIAPVLATGNMAVGDMALAGYRNGNPEAGAHVWAGVQTFSIYIGARNNGPGIGQACTANIESAALYSCILTNAQVLDVATAMSQL